jgi:hypothetical protein
MKDDDALMDTLAKKELAKAFSDPFPTKLRTDAIKKAEEKMIKEAIYGVDIFDQFEPYETCNKFELKQGQEGVVEPGGGMKWDAGKLRIDLVDPKFVQEVGEVLTYGAQKYEDNSWQKLSNPKERYKAALLRHLYQYLSGELVDDESHLTHLQHLATNVMFLMYFEREND